MSGVSTGSRLEQLEALRARLDHEIAVERRKLKIDPPTKGIRTSPAVSISRLLNLPRASDSEVREWAKEHDIPVGARGRVSDEVHAKYQAHRVQQEVSASS